jgi:hypothetical protein
LAIHTQVFDLSYYSQGAFNQEIAYNLPTHLRIFYLRKLAEVRKKENEQMEKAQKDAGGTKR